MRLCIVVVLAPVLVIGCGHRDDSRAIEPKTDPRPREPAAVEPVEPREPVEPASVGPAPAACASFDYDTCPKRCERHCTSSGPESLDCDGPDSCLPRTEPLAAPREDCGTFRYGNCPPGCDKSCMKTCIGCLDCGGPGSCHAMD